MKIFLDANILFSAAKSTGAIHRLLDVLLVAEHECRANDYVLAEARRNLEAKAPEGIGTLEKLLARLRVAKKHLRPEDHADLPLPPKDRPVLAAAIQCRCDALVTGDRTHFGALYGETIQGVTVYSPRSLAEAVLR